MVKLSIVCTCYNTEKYIQESLDSVFNQTHKDYELILIDDASTDNTFSIIEKYINTPNVKVIRNQINSGVFVSRTYGFLQAEGEYIAIHDSDDISLPNRFEKQISFLEKHKHISVLGSHAVKIGEFGQVIGNMSYPTLDTPSGFKVITQYKLNPIIDPSAMICKKDLFDIGGYRLEERFRYAADFDLWCRMLCKGCLIWNLQEPLIKYRMNLEGCTVSKHGAMREATDVIWGTFCKRDFPQLEPLKSRIRG